MTGVLDALSAPRQRGGCTALPWGRSDGAGAGGGSIALWLAEQVGPSGSVLATDIDTRFLEGLARPNLAIRRHDIATDALPEAAFDLVHARFVLVHVPQRDTALQRMVRALKPGGWLVVEEPGAPVVQPEPELDPA